MNILIALLFVMSIVACNKNANPKTIVLNTEGTLDVKADYATLKLKIECLNMDIEKAGQCLADKSKEIKAFFAEQNISKDDYITTNVQLRKKTDWKNDSRVFVGYLASLNYTVTVREIESLQAMYAELLVDDKLNLGSLSFHHTKYDSLTNEAYAKALQNASNTVDRILLDIPETSKQILSISNVSYDAVSNNSRGVKRKKSGGSRTQLKPALNFGYLQFTKEIFVEYQIQ